MTQERRSDEQPPQGDDLLEGFLNSIDNYVQEVSSLAVDAAGDGELRSLIEATGASVLSQTRNVTTFARGAARGMSTAERREMDEFLSVQDGEAIARNGVETAKRVMARGFVKNLLKYLKKILELLKKLLRGLFEALNIKFPKWLDVILDVIDEMADLLLEILGEVFGIDFRTTAQELSEMSVQFLNEQAALARLNLAQATYVRGMEAPAGAEAS